MCVWRIFFHRKGTGNSCMHQVLEYANFIKRIFFFIIIRRKAICVFGLLQDLLKTTLKIHTHTPFPNLVSSFDVLDI